MLRVVRKLPGTTSALLLGLAVCAAMWMDFFGGQELLQPVPRWLRFPILPGGFCFYVVGTFTRSAGLASTAFVIGTLTVYLGIGLAFDVAVWLVRRRANGRCVRRSSAQ